MDILMKRLIRTLLSLFLLPASLTMQAQIDFKLEFANNVGDVGRIRQIKTNGSGLNWAQIRDGAILGNSPDVDEVKNMFASKDQKTRKDQKLFWKMRDDNLLCFRINEGKGNTGQYQVRVRTSKKDQNGKHWTQMKNVSSYFFINCNAQTDTLHIAVNRLGCSASPADTLHVRYYVYGWDDSDLYLFKLDSKRRRSGLTYQLEYVLRNEKNEDTKEVLELSGSSFQSFYVPKDKVLKNVYLVSESKNRVALDIKRLVYGVNLSDKLNHLWLDDNFTLDKHENRELTIFNMLGSGLFEKFDTLNLYIYGKGGKPVEVPVVDKKGEGFTFNVAQVDENGKFVKELKDSYVGYNQKTGLHKILTFGNPCYIEVFAPDHMPAVFKYAGAKDPKDGVMSRDRLKGTLYMIPGDPTKDGPDVAGQMVYILKDAKSSQTYDGKTHEVFTVDSLDLNSRTSSSSILFFEDGGYQKTPKLLNGKPVEKYAEIGFSYSRSKSKQAVSPKLTFVEKDGGATLTATTTTGSTLDGNDYPCFSRSYFEQRWSLVGILPKKDVEYKPKLDLGDDKPFVKIPYFVRKEYNQQKMEDEGKKKALSYTMTNGSPDTEKNGFQWTVLGKMGSFNILGKDLPGIAFNVTPNIDVLNRIFELDLDFSWGMNDRNKTDGKWGGPMRDKYKETQKLNRYQLGGEFGEAGKQKTSGIDVLNKTGLSKRTKDKWLQAELDDICTVKLNKLGYGFFFDAHFGLGFNFHENNEAESFYLKAAEVTGGFGTAIAFNGDPTSAATGAFARVIDKIKNVLQLKFEFCAESNIQLSTGFKTWNYMNGDITTKRMYGFYAEGMVYAQAGGSMVLQTSFGDPNDGGKGFYNGIFNASAGARLGAKAMAKFTSVWPFGDRAGEWDKGAACLLFAAFDLFYDLRLLPVVRVKGNWSIKFGGRYWFFPDGPYNPANPLYPNYKVSANARQFFEDGTLPSSLEAPSPSLQRPRLTPRLAAASEVEASQFLLGDNLMENLDETARPRFLGEDRFVICHNNTTQNLNDDRLMEFNTRQEGVTTMTKADGTLLPGNDHLAQNHHTAKEGDIELVVSEEMTSDIDINVTNATIEQLNATLRNAAIVANMRTTKNGEWKRQVVAYDASIVDANPVGAVNIDCTPENPTPTPTNRAACLWKRGTFYPLMTEEELAGMTEEEKANWRDLNTSLDVSTFDGDLMLSFYDGSQWNTPQSLLKFSRKDIVKDYQILMSNDTVLVAVSVMPEGKDSLELRYYCKPKDKPAQVITDKMVPISFSMDMVGDLPYIAILNRPDSTCTDIYVKAINMKGEYLGYGADLDLNYHNPMSVKLIADKSADAPMDFAVVWEKMDNAIRQNGKYLQTDSVQFMLNCSRVYMNDNLQAAPYITLGCSTDKLHMSAYDVFLNEDRAIALWTLTDYDNGQTYLMRNEVAFYNDFLYNISYTQEMMNDGEVMLVGLNIYNMGDTPIIDVEGYLNGQFFKFSDLFIHPYDSESLSIEYELPENFNGLLQATGVTAYFNDLSYIRRASNRASSLRASAASEDLTDYATGYSDVRCKVISHSIEGSKNKVYVELTDYDGLNTQETLYVGLYPDHVADIPITSTAEVKLKASDFEDVGSERKAWVELTADNLPEEVEVFVRARVYNDNVLKSLGADDNLLDAIVDNRSWHDNLCMLTLLPSELDDVTGLPVVAADKKIHKVKVEKVEGGVWLSGLESDDIVRIFDVKAMPVYLNRTPTERLFVPIQERGVYLLSTGQEVVKFQF